MLQFTKIINTIKGTAMRDAKLVFGYISEVYDQIDMRNSPPSPKVMYNRVIKRYPEMSATTRATVETFLFDTFLFYSSYRVVPMYLKDNFKHSLRKMELSIEKEYA